MLFLASFRSKVFVAGIYGVSFYILLLQRGFHRMVVHFEWYLVTNELLLGNVFSAHIEPFFGTE